MLEALALQLAHLTNNHALSDAASITIGKLVHLALAWRSLNRMRREASLNGLPVNVICQLPGKSFTKFLS